MFKFIKTQEKENPYDLMAVEVSTDAACLGDIFEAFKGFLQASGFQIDGVIEVTPDEDPSKET